MLGKRSRLLEQPTNKSQLMLATCYLYAKPRTTNKSTVGISRQVVGFDPDDLENLDAVRSPRSVLEQRSLSGIAIVGSQEKQARSKKSGLEPLIASARVLVDSRSTTKSAGPRTVASMRNAGDQEKNSKPSPTAQSQPIWIVRNQPFSSPDSLEDYLQQVSLGDEGPHRASSTESNEPDSEMRTFSRESIFSTSPSTICSEDLPLNDFLSACFFCKCQLRLGKDIFMYRGDRAFCSPECRYQQILADERKEGGSASADLRSEILGTKPAATP